MSQISISPTDVAPPRSEDDGAANRRYLLWLLVVVYAIAFGQRQLFSILNESIKREFGLSDTVVGLLAGVAFAVVHALAGVPVAGLAGKVTRRMMLAVGLVAWSLCTALTGLAGSVIHLVVLRAGIGISQAACVPASHSLIADAFPPARRATAFSIYALGIPLGALAAFLAGGWLDETCGWRATFLVAGLPGVALAVVVALTLAEPSVSERRAPPNGLAALRLLWRIPSFRHVCAAGALRSFAAVGISTFMAPFLIRIHGWRPGEVGTWLGLAGGLGGGLGTYLGGVLADSLSARFGRHWNVWVPAFGTLASLVPWIFVCTAHSGRTAMLFYFPYIVCATLYMGPTFSIAQALAPKEMRTLASAALMSFINLIGFSLGPQVVGIVSDAIRRPFGPDSLRYSLLGCVIVAGLWSVAHYLWTARSYVGDARDP